MSVPDGARLLAETRLDAGITQKELAVRAGVSQAAISRLERGERALSVETLERMLLLMGRRLELGSERLPVRFDRAHLAAEAELTPAERLERAFSWAQFNDALLRAGKRARS